MRAARVFGANFEKLTHGMDCEGDSDATVAAEPTSDEETAAEKSPSFLNTQYIIVY